MSKNIGAEGFLHDGFNGYSGLLAGPTGFGKSSFLVQLAIYLGRQLMQNYIQVHPYSAPEPD
jgi:RecA-family ATPase